MTMVKAAFDMETVSVSIDRIQALRQVPPAIKQTHKYRQILASIREVGVVEPPVVARGKGKSGSYLLLDGHLRIEALKDLGLPDVVCLISTDDEAFTYNKRVNRVATIQQHRMILKAVERGVPEERIARALDVDVPSISRLRRLLDGICPEAAELLKDKHCPIMTFQILKRMAPFRQIEAASLMVQHADYTEPYAKVLLASTPKDLLADPAKPKAPRGISPETLAQMERELANLHRDAKLMEQSYGTDVLHLVLAKGYVSKLLGNARAIRYLSQQHPEILQEFQVIAEMATIRSTEATR